MNAGRDCQKLRPSLLTRNVASRAELLFMGDEFGHWSDVYDRAGRASHRPAVHVGMARVGDLIDPRD